MGIFPDTMATTKNAESGENCCCVSVAPIRVQFAQCPKVQTVLSLLTADRELVVLPLHTANELLASQVFLSGKSDDRDRKFILKNI